MQRDGIVYAGRYTRRCQSLLNAIASGNAYYVEVIRVLPSRPLLRGNYGRTCQKSIVLRCNPAASIDPIVEMSQLNGKNGGLEGM